MPRVGVVVRILLSVLLALGPVGRFAHALSHLEHGHAHSGHAHSQSAAIVSDDQAPLQHDEHACDGHHAYAESHSDGSVEPLCELCVAFGASAESLCGDDPTALADPRRPATFDATACSHGFFLFAGARIRAPPAARA